MTNDKTCPNCSGPLRLYNVDVPPVRTLDIADYVVQNVVGIAIVGILWLAMSSWGVAGEVIAVVIAVAILTAIYWKPLQRRKHQDISAHGRYHCDKCGHHFEGDALRRLTAS
jgi:hypothetical protein